MSDDEKSMVTIRARRTCRPTRAQAGLLLLFVSVQIVIFGYLENSFKKNPARSVEDIVLTIIAFVFTIIDCFLQHLLMTEYEIVSVTDDAADVV